VRYHFGLFRILSDQMGIVCARSVGTDVRRNMTYPPSRVRLLGRCAECQITQCQHRPRCSVFPPVSTREHHSAFLRIVGTVTHSVHSSGPPRRSSRPRLFSAHCQPSRPRPCPRLCTRAANSGSQLSPAYHGSLRAFSTYWLVFVCCIL
jgi:hypothetical protein